MGAAARATAGRRARIAERIFVIFRVDVGWISVVRLMGREYRTGRKTRYLCYVFIQVVKGLISDAIFTLFPGRVYALELPYKSS